jgi:hypothetical protein
MSEHATKATNPPALTRAELIHLLGDLDDAVLTAILATGASYAEVEQARLWALDDAGDLGREGHELSPAAAAVHNVLMCDPAVLGLEREP